MRKRIVCISADIGLALGVAQCACSVIRICASSVVQRATYTYIKEGDHYAEAEFRKAGIPGYAARVAGTLRGGIAGAVVACPFGNGGPETLAKVGRCSRRTMQRSGNHAAHRLRVER